MTAYRLAALVALVGAAICALALVEPEWTRLQTHAARPVRRWLAVDRAHEDLAQAGLGGLPVTTWLTGRFGASVLVGLLAYLAFGVIVLGIVGCLACYHLLGMALERRRRRHQLERQQALLEAVRYGAAVMARGGSAGDMTRALAHTGPMLARPIFARLTDGPDGVGASASLPARTAALREELAEPLFDDVALALILHWKQGAKLVPALEAIAQDWTESVRLQREAKVLRAAVEASVLILTVLPIAFLTLLQLLAPDLLRPFHSAPGQILLGLAALWMVLGYRVLQRMSEPPREERLRLRETEP